jgi:hypothetical protein
MKRIVASLLLLAAFASCADLRKGKVIKVRDASETGATAGSNDPVAAKNGAMTVLLPGVVTRGSVTVWLDSTDYTAIFNEDKHFKQTDLVEGQMIDTRVDGSKLVLRRPSDGKEMKGKIVRKESSQTQ